MENYPRFDSKNRLLGYFPQGPPYSVEELRCIQNTIIAALFVLFMGTMAVTESIRWIYGPDIYNNEVTLTVHYERGCPFSKHYLDDKTRGVQEDDILQGVFNTHHYTHWLYQDIHSLFKGDGDAYHQLFPQMLTFGNVMDLKFNSPEEDDMLKNLCGGSTWHEQARNYIDYVKRVCRRGENYSLWPKRFDPPAFTCPNTTALDMIANASRLSADAWQVIESSFLFDKERLNIHQAVERAGQERAEICEDITGRPDHVYMYVVGLFGEVRGGYMHMEGLDKLLKDSTSNDWMLFVNTHTVHFSSSRVYRPFDDISKTKYTTYKIHTCRKIPLLHNDARIPQILRLDLDHGCPAGSCDEDDTWP